MKKKKILTLSAVSIASITTVVATTAVAIAGNYFYNLALNPKKSKEIVFGPKEPNDNYKLLDEDTNWLLNRCTSKNEYIKANDGLKLHSIKILNESPSNNWVILVHGYMLNSLAMSAHAKKYYDLGYNILIPDLRGHGESEGNYIGMGYDDKFDIISWIDYILEKNKHASIVLHGLSMGAATVCMASGENLSSNVKAIISDSSYTSALEQFSYQLNELFSLPKFPILNATALIAKIRTGYSLKDASPLKHVKNSKTPILYIHGDIDDFVPYKMMKELFNATKCEKQMITIEGARHANAHKINSKLYWSSIYNFLDNYM